MLPSLRGKGGAHVRRPSRAHALVAAPWLRYNLAMSAIPSDSGVRAVAESPETGVSIPRLYRVVLVNDDYTPMDFVVDVLERFFHMERMSATQVMLCVHIQGKGVCGVYPYEIAETKVDQVTRYARRHQHPLLCTMEEN
jgi:ATP-dependent Clp protease adaptor protein ClpS